MTDWDDPAVKPSQAIQELGDLNAEAGSDASVFVEGPSHTLWRARADSVLSAALGDDAETTRRFRGLDYHLGVSGDGSERAGEAAKVFRGCGLPESQEDRGARAWVDRPPRSSLL